MAENALQEIQTCYKQKKWVEVERLCIESRQAGLVNRQLPIYLANSLFHQKKFAKALGLCEQFLSNYPNNVSMLILQAQAFEQVKRPNLALRSWQSALKLAPKSIEVLFPYAQYLDRLKRYKAAAIVLSGLLKAHPDHLSAIINCSNCYRKLGRRQLAKQYQLKALELDPKSIQANTNFALSLTDEGHYEKAMEHLKVALASSPEYIPALNNLANVLQFIGRYQEAIEIYDKVLQKSPELTAALWNKGTAMLHLDISEDAWQLFETRPLESTHSEIARITDFSLDHSTYKDKTILIEWEARLGDCMQMMRYINAFKTIAKKTILQLPEELTGLGAVNFPWASIASPKEKVQADWRIPYMSLPLFMGVVSTDLIKPAISYIQPEKSSKLDALFRPKKQQKYVGLVWRGNPVPAHRSIPFEQITQLLNLPDIQFVTLQKKLEESEKKVLSTYSNVQVFDEQLSDFSTTAAIVDKLDLIITIDSAVAHLAGGLGKDCWVLLKDGADWRWNGKAADQTAWYPSMRLFRQTQLGSWSEVLDSLLVAIPKWLSSSAHKF